MSQDAKSASVSRRKFLLVAGAGAGTVAAAQVASVAPAAATNPGAEETRSRYRLSEEVKTFYRVNGYEGRR